MAADGSEAAADRPLAGVRLLDLTQFLSGPQATLFLAGLGVEVIRIDHPAGNRLVDAPPFVGPAGVALERQTDEDIGQAYLKRMRGKRSLTLDLKHPEGRRLFLALVARADVVVENFSVGVMARLGLDYDALSAHNPRLIYCSISGFGQDGPDAEVKAYDPIVQAATGLMSLTGEPGGPPTKAGASLADGIAGIWAVAAIAAALYERERTGCGRRLDVSMADTLFALLFDEPLDHYRRFGWPSRLGSRLRRVAPFNRYPTRDGWIVAGAGTEAQWRPIAEAIGQPELADDPRYADLSGRLAHNAALDEAIGAWTRELTRAEALARLEAAGVIAGPVRELDELLEWEQLRARGMLEDVVHPTLGRRPEIQAPGFPLKLDGTAPGYPGPARPTGADSDAILRELLGLSDTEIARLHHHGAI